MFKKLQQITGKMVLGSVILLCLMITPGCVSVESSSEADRQLAVAQVKDQEALAKLVLDAKYEDVKQEAARQITDQSILAKLVFQSKEYKVRSILTEKIEDQHALQKLATEKGSAKAIRETAVYKIVDQKFLLKVAFEDENEDVRGAAIEKLVAQEDLLKVILEEKSSKLRWKAYNGRLTKPELLQQLAPETIDGEILESLIEKFDDQKTLAQMAMGWTYPDIRMKAFEKLSDQELIGQVALQAENKKIRRSAIDKITNTTEKVEAEKNNVYKENHEVVEKMTACTVHVLGYKVYVENKINKLSAVSTGEGALATAKKQLADIMIKSLNKYAPDPKLKEPTLELFWEAIMKRDKVDIKKASEIGEKIIEARNQNYFIEIEKYNAFLANHYNKQCQVAIDDPEQILDIDISRLDR